MIRGVIIDDEQNARDTLRILLNNYCSNVELVGEANDVKSGLDCILRKKPNLVFLDIEMPDGDGFDLLRAIQEIKFDVIFTTAYSEFALQAFRFNAIDYLLKPIVYEELINAVNKAEMELQNRDLSKKFSRLLAYISSGTNNKRIVLATNEKYHLVNISEIIMCRSDKNYTVFYLENGTKITTSKTMKDYIEMLSESGFIRSHRQYMVNVKHIQSFERANENTILLTHDIEAPVSIRNKDKLMEVIHQIQ
jgi:two-component system, LytTR family, response regulator